MRVLGKGTKLQWEYPVRRLKPKTCFFTVNIIGSHVNNLAVRRWFLNSVLSIAFHNTARDKGSRDIMKLGAWVKIGLCLRACGRSCKISQWRIMFYSRFLSKNEGSAPYFVKEEREEVRDGVEKMRWNSECLQKWGTILSNPQIFHFHMSGFPCFWNILYLFWAGTYLFWIFCPYLTYF